MTTPQSPRWYCVNNMGMATLCADQADAEMTAKDCNIQWPRQAPHRAVQLVEVSALDTERTARIAAQVENEALKAERARSGLAHRKAVQEAVAEAVATEREACALVCESICWSAEIDAWIAMTKKEISSMSAHQCASAIRARGTP